MEPYLASISFYIYAIIFCRLCIHLACSKTSLDRDKLQLVNEFFMSLQACAVCFENGAFLHYYGWLAYGTVLTLIGMVNFKCLNGAHANPALTIEAGVRHKMPWSTVGARLLAQLSGGMIAYRFNSIFWSFGLYPRHAAAYITYACFTDLKVSIAIGLVMEFVAATLAQFADLSYSSRFSRDVAALLMCATCAVITCLGVSYTGMYYNPILASSLTFGCDGLDNLSHVMVYWLGPCVGQFVGTEIHAKLYKVSDDKIKIQ